MAPSAALADLVARQKRCIWSDTVSDDLVEVEVPTVDRIGRPAGTRTFRVRPEHREAFVAFSRFTARWARWLLPGFGLWLAVTVALATWLELWGAAIGLALLGAYVYVLPLATPETVSGLGIRKS